MRRRNFHDCLDRMVRQFREWRENNYGYRMNVPNTTLMTPMMGEMTEHDRDVWARRITVADAEASINRSNESRGLARGRTGEAL